MSDHPTTGQADANRGEDQLTRMGEQALVIVRTAVTNAIEVLGNDVERHHEVQDEWAARLLEVSVAALDVLTKLVEARKEVNRLGGPGMRIVSAI